MPLITCASCGEDTLTLAGWSANPSCAGCGRSLRDGAPAIAEPTMELRRTRIVSRRFAPPTEPATEQPAANRGAPTGAI